MLFPLMASGVQQRSVTRAGAQSADWVAVEEPLEIRVATEPVAVTMRTPGEDAQLALGFLFAEGVIRSTDDVGSVAHCGRLGEEGYGNAIDITAAPGVVLNIESSRRGTLTTAACGVCGRKSIDDLLARCRPLPLDQTISTQLLARSTEQLGTIQKNFAQTGGVHAAAALDAEGKVLVAFEDIGRHNAVDKVVGALLLRKLIGAPALLVVSGRASFEIVQKAAMARIPAVACVSAASTLAIDLAEKVGITLATFVRDGTFNVYTGRSRLRKSD